MKEDFLHYIWQFQYFDKKELQTCDGQGLIVLHVGSKNSDAGPDFWGSRIRLDEIEWYGCVEIHVRASDWYKHGHSNDRKYDQVILHVVWENDVEIRNSDQAIIPTLELKQIVSEDFIKGYKKILESSDTIACSKLNLGVPQIYKISMFDRTLSERLSQKASVIIDRLKKCNYDWDSVAYEVLAKCFGFKVNENGFEALSRILPYAILRKHVNNSFQIEALLFGQAGFLSESITDCYLLSLRKEYLFLKHKYDLPQDTLSSKNWNFLRLRPANFPNVRLAQFSAFISKRDRFFSLLLEIDNTKDLERFFEVDISPFWAESGFTNGLGKTSIRLLIINAVVPLLFAYGIVKDQVKYQEIAVSILEALPFEVNRTTSIYESADFSKESAADSQALLSLFHNYCSKKKCLACNIGNQILKTSNLRFDHLPS